MPVKFKTINFIHLLFGEYTHKSVSLLARLIKSSEFTGCEYIGARAKHGLHEASWND
jgi:hypothetical protein